MANVYYSQGHYERALEYYQKSLDIKIKVVGHDHVSVATSKYNIADLKEAQGELEEARSLFLECEQIYANVLGVDHEETLDAAMRAQTVGEEDKEESEEGEEDTDDEGLSDTS